MDSKYWPHSDQRKESGQPLSLWDVRWVLLGPSELARWWWVASLPGPGTGLACARRLCVMSCTENKMKESVGLCREQAFPGPTQSSWRPQPLSLTEPLGIPGPSAWWMGSPVTQLQNHSWILPIGNSGKDAKLVEVFCLVCCCCLSTHRWHHLTEKTLVFEKNWETIKFSLKLKTSIAKGRYQKKWSF